MDDEFDDLQEEALFSRDEEGRLIRLTEATARQLDQTYSLVVDGTRLKVPRAQIAKDAQGNPLSNPDGSPKLRYTTILDAIRHATEYGRVVIDAVARASGSPLPADATETPQLLGVICQSGNEIPFCDAALQLCEQQPAVATESLHAILDQKLLPDRAQTAVQEALHSGRLADAMREALLQRILFRPTTAAVERVPVLCHQDHLTPVAVCRVCAVQIANPARGRTERKLLPACQHWAQDGMVVYTMWAASDQGWQDSPQEAAAADRHRQSVRSSVQLLAELLSAQHLDEQRDQEAGRDRKYRNELLDLWNTLDHSWQRFPQDAEVSPQARADCDRARQHRPRFRQRRGSQDPLAGPIAPLPKPPDSPFHVDYSSCILCDRCSRSCTEIRHFNVIGRSGKGAATHIAFDLNGRSMYGSTCHSCGECMKACPTGAITFERTVFDVGSKRWNREFPPGQYEVVEPPDLLKHDLFRRMSLAFLQWNRGAVRRRRVKAGDVIAREHEFGNVAFVIEHGVYLVCRESVLQPLIQLPELHQELRQEFERQQHRFGGAVGLFESEKNMILGEMSPMRYERRTATVVALNAGSVLEIDRNVLAEILRVPDVREVVEDRYAERALMDFAADERLRMSLFSVLTPEENARLIDALAPTAKLVLVDPGQVICQEREPASDFFFVYQGFIKISSRAGLLTYQKPLNYIGEVAVVLQDWPEAKTLFPQNLATQGLRTATCTALDTVELFRFPSGPVRAFLNEPQNVPLRDKLRARCVQMIQPSGATR